MAVVTVGHHPELTVEKAVEIFQRYFTDKYVVYKTRLPGVDFMVKKSNWLGFAIKLKQKKGNTVFICRYVAPSTIARILTGGLFGAIGMLIQWLIFRSESKMMENDIKSFIETSLEFKDGSLEKVISSSCSRCGSPLTSEARFCKKCGVLVS